MNKPSNDVIWKSLAKYGIHTEKQLDEALARMKPINVGCMVSNALNKPVDSKAKSFLENIEDN